MYLTVSVLTTSAGLFCILAVYVYCLCKCLLVCYLRSAYVSFHVELAKQTVNDDFKMELAHTCDNRLSCLFVCVSTESRIFLCKFCKGLAHLILSCFCLRLNSDIDNRLREYHGFQDYRVLIVTDCITCRGELESDSCSDIAGVNFV